MIRRQSSVNSSRPWFLGRTTSHFWFAVGEAMSKVAEVQSESSGLYDRLRGQVEHENELYNQRIIWLITMQAFLYATVGLLMQARIQDEGGRWANQIDAFVALVCVLGAIVAGTSNRVLSNSRKSLSDLCRSWDEYRVGQPPELMRLYPHIGGGVAHRGYLFRSGNLPIFFAGSWVLSFGILLLHRFVP